MEPLHIILPQIKVENPTQANATLEFYRQAIYTLDQKVKELEARIKILEP